MKATNGHTNSKVDKVRVRTATTIQWLNGRAGGHTAPEMDGPGPRAQIRVHV